MRRWLICWILLALIAAPVQAQDAFNLPASLYVLTAEGRVDRYGLGTEGVRAVTPEDVFVVDFGIAPDDTWLAYRTESALVLRHIYNETSVEIDGALAGVPPVRGQGDTIVWSPAGDALAVTTETGGRVYINVENDLDSQTPYKAIELLEGGFVQVLWSPDGRYLAAEAAGDIWWLYRREDNNIILTSAIPAATGLTWYSATQAAFTPTDGGLRLMDLSAANAQTILLDDTWEYQKPFLQINGTLAVFGRQKDSTEVPPGFGRLIGLPANETRIDNLGEVPIELSDLYWMPEGSLLLAFRGGALGLVSPVTAQGFPLPIESAVAYSWGPPPLPRVESVTLPAAAFFIADADTGTPQVWRLPADGSAAVPVTTEEAGISSFSVALDGQRIVYTSENRLVLQRLNGSGPVPLAELSGDQPAQPAFSPDGQQVAYVDNGIWLVSANGGDARQVIADDLTAGFERRFAQPIFAPNLSGLLVQVIRPDITVPGVLDPNTGEVLEIALEQNASWLSDGRILLYGVAADGRRGGLSIAGLGTLSQPAQFLPDILSVQSAREISPNQVRLVLPERLLGPQTLRTAGLDITTGSLTPAFTGGYIDQPMLSPDGQFVGGYAYRVPFADGWRGPLTFLDLQTGEQVVLTTPPSVWDFTWAQA
jgi:hypothetical protein